MRFNVGAFNSYMGQNLRRNCAVGGARGAWAGAGGLSEFGPPGMAGGALIGAGMGALTGACSTFGGAIFKSVRWR